MSSTTTGATTTITTPEDWPSWMVRNPNQYNTKIPLTEVLEIVIPIVVCLSLLIITLQWCRIRYYRRRVRALGAQHRRDEDEEEGKKPTVYDVYLDTKHPLSDEKRWKDITPLSVTMLSPKELDANPEATEVLAPETLMVYQMNLVSQAVKEVLDLIPIPSRKPEEDDLTLVTGVVLQMPSPQTSAYYKKQPRTASEDEPLPELLLGCKEIPWRRTDDEKPASS